MKTGISIYPGLDRSAKENMTLLEKAAALGISRVFTSLHIPETDTAALARELRDLLQAARRYDLDVIADVSPKTQELLGLTALTPAALLSLGITTVRLDYGFDVRKTALFSQAMRVQLNASTLKPAYLAALRDCHADFRHIDSLHNFYPRPHTGLGLDYFLQQTRMLQQAGIKVGSFIASRCGRRTPLYEGLPTLEDDRCRSVSLAARHALALGVDSVFIGDDAPAEEELEALARCGREERDTVVLRIRPESREPFVQDLLEQPMTARPDAARDAIRASESRTRTAGHTIAPDETAGLDLSYGDISIDNAGYGRYQGEVQISLAKQPGDPRTNRAAYVLPEEQFLIARIRPGQKFRFEIVR